MNIVFEHFFLNHIFIIFAAALAAGLLITVLKQPFIFGYMLAGIIFGPTGLAVIDDPSELESLSKVGIIFLLFILGLNLKPKRVISMFKEAVLVSVASSILFFLIVYLSLSNSSFHMADKVFISLAMIFSSTIVAIKLLPTTTLHHKRRGEMIISVLLFQDILAIVIIMVIKSYDAAGFSFLTIMNVVFFLPIFLMASLFCVTLFLEPLIKKFGELTELLFLIAVGWCSLLALVSERFGASFEIGAFFAGISLANSIGADFFAEKLKPIRDFFLIIFFFCLGARVDFSLTREMIFYMAFLTGFCVFAKSQIFRFLFKSQNETDRQSREVGVRLGHGSEFAILLMLFSFEMGLSSKSALDLVQIVVVASFLIGSYVISKSYPTPDSTSSRMRQD